MNPHFEKIKAYYGMKDLVVLYKGQSSNTWRIAKIPTWQEEVEYIVVEQKAVNSMLNILNKAERDENRNGIILYAKNEELGLVVQHSINSLVKAKTWEKGWEISEEPFLKAVERFIGIRKQSKDCIHYPSEIYLAEEPAEALSEVYNWHRVFIKVPV